MLNRSLPNVLVRIINLYENVNFLVGAVNDKELPETIVIDGVEYTQVNFGEDEISYLKTEALDEPVYTLIYRTVLITNGVYLYVYPFDTEVDRLSNILKAFNDHFGTLFADADRVARRIKEDIAPKVAADQSYRNAKQNTPNSARIEHDKALSKVMLTLLKDDTQVYKQFVENESFRRFVTDMVFTMTSE